MRNCTSPSCAYYGQPRASSCACIHDRPALMTMAELEQMDDHAHVNGRARQLERAHRALMASDGGRIAAHMVEQCRERIETHADTARYFLKMLMWFDQYPNELIFETPQAAWTRTTARNEYQLARRLHGKVCRQLADWKARAAEPPDYEHAVSQHFAPVDRLDAPANTDRSSSAA